MSKKEHREDFDRFLARLVSLKANALFLKSGEPPFYRVKGRILRDETTALTADDVRLIAEALFEEKGLHQIGTESAQLSKVISIETGDASKAEAARKLQVVVTKACGDYLITANLLEVKIPKPAEIGVPDSVLKAAESSHGLIIFSGPAGSGKTTTALSVIDHLNAKGGSHICVISEHYVYDIGSKKSIVQQKVVGLDVPDAVSAIDTALSQGIDILVVSDVWGAYELDACLEAVDSGRLVLIIVNAESPEDALDCIVREYSTDRQNRVRALLSRNVVCSVSQRLLPRKDGKGRVAAYGVLLPDDEMRKAILEGRDVFKRVSPLPDGCRTLDDSIEHLRSEHVED